jgi:hypothetical protein
VTDYDVFNGDADGICSLVQLRQIEPRDAVLITGVKRDINLLSQVKSGKGDQITVLDISMERNSTDLNRILDQGATVFYVDHHNPGKVPTSSSLISIINESADVSTSLLVNQYLLGARIGWGIVGTFGDNLKKSAHLMSKHTGYSSEEIDKLEKLGIYMNYNGYGSSLDDLHFSPQDLYNLVLNYTDPLDFLLDGHRCFEKLEAGYLSDFASAQAVSPLRCNQSSAVYSLPDKPWARRVSGVFSNRLTNQYPRRAHAVVIEKSCGSYLVSVRAPLQNKQGAGQLCGQFHTGGGREAAAGINDLPANQLDYFIRKFEQTYRA